MKVENVVDELIKNHEYSEALRIKDEYHILIRDILKVFKSEKKQLLVNYHMFLRENGDKHIGLSIEEFVNLYLESI